MQTHCVECVTVQKYSINYTSDPSSGSVTTISGIEPVRSVEGRERGGREGERGEGGREGGGRERGGDGR